MKKAYNPRTKMFIYYDKDPKTGRTKIVKVSKE